MLAVGSLVFIIPPTCKAFQPIGFQLSFLQAWFIKDCSYEKVKIKQCICAQWWWHAWTVSSDVVISYYCKDIAAWSCWDREKVAYVFSPCIGKVHRKYCGQFLLIVTEYWTYVAYPKSKMTLQLNELLWCNGCTWHLHELFAIISPLC